MEGNSPKIDGKLESRNEKVYRNRFHRLWIADNSLEISSKTYNREDVNAYAASSFYAVDRYASYKKD